MKIEDFGNRKKRKGKKKKGKKGKKGKDKKRKGKKRKAKWSKEFNWTTKRIAAALIQEMLVEMDVRAYGLKEDLLIDHPETGDECLAIPIKHFEPHWIDRMFHHRPGWCTEGRMDEIQGFIDKVLESFQKKLSGITHA